MPRSAVIAGAAVALILVSAVFFLSSRGGQMALFAVPLHAEQLDEVEQRLADWNVPFTPLTDNVLVAAKQRNAVLLRLSLANVPHAHIESSSEMLAKVGTLTPQTILDEQKRNGLEADLELALRGIDGIDDALIIIAPAKAPIYADEPSREATASVRLHLRPGARLPPSTIAGIRAFIAAGVPDLLPKDVTILDDRGFALRDEALDVDAQSLLPAVQSALDQTFGSGIAIARASTAGARAQRSIVVLVDQRHALQLDDVSAVASAAAGVDFHRGDRVEVEAVHFRDAPPHRKLLWFGVAGSAIAIAPTAIICVAFLIALRIGLGPTINLVKSLTRTAMIGRAQRDAPRFSPDRVRGVLQGEPPHTAAAIISALPAATAAAVLDLYPSDERAAIIRRMSRAHSPLVPDVETFISHA